MEKKATRAAKKKKGCLGLKEAVIKMRFMCCKLLIVPSLKCEISDGEKVSQKLNLSTVLLQKDLQFFHLCAKCFLSLSCWSYSCKATDNQKCLKGF